RNRRDMLWKILHHHTTTHVSFEMKFIYSIFVRRPERKKEILKTRTVAIIRADKAVFEPECILPADAVVDVSCINSSSEGISSKILIDEQSAVVTQLGFANLLISTDRQCCSAKCAYLQVSFRPLLSEC